MIMCLCACVIIDCHHTDTVTHFVSRTTFLCGQLHPEAPLRILLAGSRVIDASLKDSPFQPGTVKSKRESMFDMRHALASSLECTAAPRKPLWLQAWDDVTAATR